MILEIVNSTFGRSSNIAFRTSKIASQLAKEGYPHAVLCRKSVVTSENVRPVWPGGDLLPRLLNGVRTHFLPTLPSRKIDNKIFSFFVRRELKRLQTKQVRLVHLWEPIPEIVDFFRQLHIPVVFEVAIAPAFYGKQLLEAGLQSGSAIDPELIDAEHFCLHRSTHILAPSPFVRDLIEMDGVPRSKITVVPFGSDPSPHSIEYPRSGGSIDFAFAGTFNSRKGAAVLLRAWESEQFAADRLHICGHVFKEFKQALRPFSNIQTPGFVQTQEYLRKCHVYVLPTLMEGSAKSVYEAMGLGMPVITTPAAGSILENGKEGFIVELGNADALREKMLFFKEHPEAIQQMGEAARKKAALYPWSRYAKAVTDVYRELIQQSSQ